MVSQFPTPASHSTLVVHKNETEEEQQDRLRRKQTGDYFLNDFKIL